MKQRNSDCVCLLGLLLATRSLAAASTQGEVLSKEGSVDFARGPTNWSPAVVGQPLLVADRLRTLALSRAMLQLAELGRLRVNELTTLEILPPRTNVGRATLDLKSGAMYFFSRDRPREFLIQTPHAVAASRGTEFLVTIEPTGRNVFTVFDGEIELSNPLGSLVLTNGEQGAVQIGQAPIKTAVIQAANIVQWWLYYPGVLDTGELPLTPAEQTALATSLRAYREGDLPVALANYPAGRGPQSDAGKIYYAALLLSAGQVDQAEAQLAGTASLPAHANALRQAIAAVNLRPFPENSRLGLATEWLAHSYFQQARFDLRRALESARAATQKSPDFGFAWERVAELEFSFGRTAAAREALEKSLQLSPRNAQAWALRGFLDASQNHLREARNAFASAIELDSALGNGWLGRGLVRIRAADAQGGRGDLQTAAAMEPNRSVLRSYLGKAFDNLNERTKATKELRLAKELDPADPTPWLYSALLLRQQLRYNEAIQDLQTSILLNTNRAVYRSRLLLDEDQAVRSSSLATIYQNAGMNDVSVREAARAVAADYANPSAHLFLAESFNALRDPTRFNLRIETAWFNELLLANLLAPVGGGNLSQNISQQEYSRLFEGNRLGVSTFSEYRSDEQFRELASQFGLFGNTSYALDVDYQHNEGVRPNNELDRLDWYTTLKQQFTAQDSVLLLTKYQDYHSGDNFQRYDQSVVRTNYSLDEYQHPLLAVGYHHEWQPGVHTLFLGARLDNDQRLQDTGVNQAVLFTNEVGQVTNAATLGIDPVTGNDNGGMDLFYRSQFATYSAELNQIFQGERNIFVFGARFQRGDFSTHNLLANPQPAVFVPFFLNPPVSSVVNADFGRESVYGYYTVEPVANLWLTAGLAYDHLLFPANYRLSPVSPGEDSRTQWSPKAALVWSPAPEVTLRGVFSRALGGVSFDESFRLEPTQLAGFNQSFRTIISESIAGSVSAPTYEVAGGALDLKFKTRTYLGIQGELLGSEVRRNDGVFAFDGSFTQPIVPSSTREHLDYDESSVVATVNQLLSDEWSFGAQYRFTHSELRSVLPDIPLTVVNPLSGQPIADRTERADLHQTTLFALFNHPSGFFARAESQWYHQNNFGYTPALASEDFWQHNFFIGWRLRRQHGELSVGVLNLADTDYHLNPLNLYAELPRERVFAARLKLNF